MLGVDHSGSRAHLCSSAGLHHTAAHHITAERDLIKSYEEHS